MIQDPIAQQAAHQRQRVLDMQHPPSCAAEPPVAESRVTPTPPSDPAALETLQTSLKALAPIPWLTHALVGLNILIFGITAYLSSHVVRIPADQLLRWGGNAASEVQKGDLWRLMSATFLHGGALHLFFNMLGLYSAGVLVERIYGRRCYALIYLGSGFVGSAASLHYAAQNAVSIGASGAVFGITAALLVGIFEHRHRLPETFSRPLLTNLGIFIVSALVNGFTHSGIDNAAHIGGLLTGAALAWMLPERFSADAPRVAVLPRLLQSSALVLSAALALALLAPPAEIDQMKRLSAQENMARAFKEFDAAMKIIAQEEANLKSGHLSLREADARSRSVLAPMMQNVVNSFSLTDLTPNDPRRPLYLTTRHLSELLLESFAMESIFYPGDETPHPVDPVRMNEIEADIKAVTQRLEALIQAANKPAAKTETPRK